jgi:hypothetical protein
MSLFLTAAHIPSNIFKFGEPGIRHEDPRMIKVRLPQQLPIYIIELDSCSLTERDTQIFPLSLHKLLALNDQVQQSLMVSECVTGAVRR